MNTYAKYCPNVFVAKCTEKQEKGETILIETKYGNGHECIVFNYLGQTKDGFFLYSVVRADGFNVQEWAKRKAEKLNGYAANAEKRSESYFIASQEGKDFLSLGEPIKVGHHSEKRHRALIERNWDRIGKSVQETEKAATYQNRAAYWESKAHIINLSMPESLEYFEHKLEQAKARQEGLKNGTIKREHSYSLPYATKEVKEIEDKIKIAKKLWADN